MTEKKGNKRIVAKTRLYVQETGITYERGEVLEVPAEKAEILIERGYAEGTTRVVTEKEPEPKAPDTEKE